MKMLPGRLTDATKFLFSFNAINEYFELEKPHLLLPC